MTTKAALRLRTALLGLLLGGNEPLAGDLIEEGAHRSRTWFWRQVAFALLARAATGAAGSLRDPARLQAPLASLAIFMVLCFQIVVTGSLLAGIIPVPEVAGRKWLGLAVVLSSFVAYGTGAVARRLCAASRVATVVLCGASAAVTALAIRSTLGPPTAAFFPAVDLQAMAAIVFAIGLFAGAASTSWPSSHPTSDGWPR